MDSRIDVQQDRGVRLDGDALWERLRALDDPNHLEQPSHMDWSATRERFDRLVDALEDAFGCKCEADRGVQDASLHARVVVPVDATATGERLVVSVSNFGWLATVSIVNPGAFDADEHAALLSPEDARRLDRVLDTLDYVVVPEAPLWRTYDGPSRLDLVSPGHSSWWIRYFDYL